MISGVIRLYSIIHAFSDDVQVEAEITAIETYRNTDGELHYRAYVSYTFEKHEYKDVLLGIYTSNMYEGKRIEVYVDADNPEHVESKTRLWVDFVAFMGFGAVFSLIGWIPIIGYIKKARKKAWLLQNGKILYGTVESINWNSGYAVNGRHPYLIYCTYTDEFDGTMYRFKSENLWYDPGVSFSLGSEIKVYVKQDDYSYYYVDTESGDMVKVKDYT